MVEYVEIYMNVSPFHHDFDASKHDWWMCCLAVHVKEYRAEYNPLQASAARSSGQYCFIYNLHSLFLFCTILKQIPDIFCLKTFSVYLWKRTLLFFTLLFLIYDFFKYLQVLGFPKFFVFFKKALFESVYLFDANKIEILSLIEMSFRPLSIYWFSVHLPPPLYLLKQLSCLSYRARGGKVFH